MKVNFAAAASRRLRSHAGTCVGHRWYSVEWYCNACFQMQAKRKRAGERQTNLQEMRVPQVRTVKLWLQNVQFECGTSEKYSHLLSCRTAGHVNYFRSCFQELLPGEMTELTAQRLMEASITPCCVKKIAMGASSCTTYSLSVVVAMHARAGLR